MADHKEEEAVKGNVEQGVWESAEARPNPSVPHAADASSQELTIRDIGNEVHEPATLVIGEIDPPSKTEEPAVAAEAISQPLLGDEEPLSGIPETRSTTSSSISNSALEVDPGDDNTDGDSAISATRNPSSTDSIRSSVYDFVEEYGRTYHRYKQGKYLLPNDLAEQDRLDLQHHLMIILLENKLNLAPINPNLQNVLDIGTGTGIWAIEFAGRHPSASVLGTDLSPIQPAFVPPNCRFEIDDAEDEWTFSTRFDFIHMRGLLTCFADHRAQIFKAFNALTPGGYLEMQDAEFPLKCHDETLLGTSLDEWSKTCVEAAAKMGRPWTRTPHYKQWMVEAGFKDVRDKVFEVPTNTWPRGKKAKELGLWLGADLADGVGSTMAFLTKGMGWSQERVEGFLVDVRKDLKDRTIHAYVPVHVIWGRKPVA